MTGFGTEEDEGKLCVGRRKFLSKVVLVCTWAVNIKYVTEENGSGKTDMDPVKAQKTCQAHASSL